MKQLKEMYFKDLKTNDWRIADNLTISLNLINTKHVRENFNTKKRDATLQMCSEYRLIRLMYKVAKVKQLPIYEATVYIKENFKTNNFLGVKIPVC